MKILLATDGSKFAEAAAAKCCELLKFDEGSKIRIVSVADYAQPLRTEHFGVSSDFYLTLNNELTKAAQTYVDEAKKIVGEKLENRPEIETEVLRGSPKEEIIEEAKRWKADVIVVGSHGYGFFGRMLIGSVSGAILHHAPCSVLVVREDSENVSETEKQE